MKPFKRPESVLVVIHSADARALVMQRTGLGKEAFWQSVTGSLEWGESINTTAQRELFEETGLQVPVRNCNLAVRFEIRAAALHRYAPGTRWNTEHLFECVLPEPVAVQLSAHEHSRYEWLSKDEAVNRVWSWTNREGILQLMG